MGSSGKLRSLQVILLCALATNFCGVSTYRLGKAKFPISDGSIFKNGREPSSAINRKPAYALQNAINTANLVPVPGPLSNALSALYPEIGSSTEVSTTIYISSTDSTPTDTSSTDASSTTEGSSTVETSSTTEGSTTVETSSTTEGSSTVDTSSTTEGSSTVDTSSTTEGTTTVETSSTTEGSSTVDTSSTTEGSTTVETSSTSEGSTTVDTNSTTVETSSTDSSNINSTSTTTTTTTDSSISNGPTGNIPANSIFGNLPSLINLIALPPDLFATPTTVPTESINPAITEPTTAVTSSSSMDTSSSTDATPTTEMSSSSTDSSSVVVSDPTTESTSSSTESSSPAVSDPTPTTQEQSPSTDSSSSAVSDPTTESTSSSTEPSSTAVSDPTPTTQEQSPSTDSSSSAVSDPTTESTSSSTEAPSPAVSDPTPTQEPSPSTDSSSAAVSDPTTEATSPSTESSSTAVSDPTPTTQEQSPSTDSSSSAVSDPTTESTSSSTEASSPAVSDPTPTQEPSPSTDSSSPAISDPTTESTSSSTESSSPAVSDPTPTTQEPSPSTDSSSPAVSDSTPASSTDASTASDTPSPPTDSTPSSSTDPTPTTPATSASIVGAGIVGQNPQVQGMVTKPITSNNVQSIFSNSAGGLNAFASYRPPFPAYVGASVAHDSPVEQIQTTASQLLVASNIPYVVNTTTSGLNAISSIPNYAGINIPQLPTLGDTPVANDSPLNQIQTATSQLLASSNIPSLVNGTTSGLNAIAALPNVTGISIPAIPTLGDAPVANDSPISQIQSAASEAVNVVNSTVNNNNPISQAQNAASQLLASSNLPSIFNTTTSGLSGFALPSFNIPQIPTFGDTPVGVDPPGLQNTAGNPPVYRPTPDLSNFQSQLAAIVSQLKNETTPFPNNQVPVQSDDTAMKPQTHPIGSALLLPNQPVPEKHPLLTIFPQQVQSDSYFGFPSFSVTNNTFGQFINQLAGLASNFTGSASNATSTNATDNTNSGTNPLQSIGNQITAGFSNVAEVISNGTAAIGSLGTQTTSSNGTSANNANGTSAAVPSANEIGGALSQLISNGTNFITAPINSIFQTNFSRALNPALTNLYNQLSSVGSNETITQVTNALSPAVLAGQLSGILSQLQASNPLSSNAVGSNQEQDPGSNGILNWNTINKLPIVSNWFGTNSNNKPISIAKPSLSCPICQQVCGKVNTPTILRQHRVVGGTVVVPANKYPWTTRFVYFNANAGQGSLINDRAIVTTATIVTGMPLFSQATALFNVYDTMSTTEQRFSKNLARVIPHPKFNPNNPFNNNIGIVILDSPVTISEFIQPICLPTSFDSYAGTQAVVAGWGADSVGGHASPVPHEVSIPLYSPAECNLANANLTHNNLCGGVVQPAQPGSVKTTCESDDGAGLMAPSRIDPSMLTLIGITIETPGSGCGSTNQPAAFTNIQNYIDFILYNGIGCGC